jgi:hypothetical protein
MKGKVPSFLPRAILFCMKVNNTVRLVGTQQFVCGSMDICESGSGRREVCHRASVIYLFG